MGARDTASGGIGGETEIRAAHADRATHAPGIAELGPARERIAGPRTEPLGPHEELLGQSQGLTENLSRERLFRRSLLSADMVAIVGAFVLLAAIFSRSLQLTLVSVCGLLALLLVSKILGLYDRDEVLLHKTTLDEAPKLFQVATLGALLAWLAGGFVVKSAR